MINEQQFQLLSIKDAGGSRDITFSPLNMKKAQDAILWFTGRYEVVECYAIYKEEEFYITPSQFFDKSYDYMFVIGINENSPIQRLQFFLSPDEDSYDLELTFFPEDVGTWVNVLDDFNYFLDLMEDAVQAEAYYIHAGNAAFNFGDLSEDSAVIYYKK